MENLFASGEPYLQQQQAKTPNTTTMAEAQYQTSVPSSDGVMQWSCPPDLSERGEGGNVVEMVSMGHQHRNNARRLPGTFRQHDQGRSKQRDSSLIASNLRSPKRLSPKGIFLNSSSSLRATSSTALAPSVNLAQTDSSHGETEEFQGVISGAPTPQGKRKLPSWAEEGQKRPKKVHGEKWQVGRHASNTRFGRQSSELRSIFKKDGAQSLPDRENSSKFMPSHRISMRAGQSGCWSHLGPSAGFVKGVGTLGYSGTVKDMNLGRPEADGSAGIHTNEDSADIAQKNISGEVSASSEIRIRRALPSTFGGSTSARSNDLNANSSVDGDSSAKMVVARQALLQAFSLADEREEATLDKGLLVVPLLKHQRIALAWMQKRESGRQEPCGGILADDQGLGKTIATISLILKNRAPVKKSDTGDAQLAQIEACTIDLDDYEEDSILGKERGWQGKAEGSNTTLRKKMASSNESQPQHDDCKPTTSPGKGRPAAGTLVVCPTSVLRQWAQEIRDKVTVEAGLSVLIYHGTNRTRDPEELAKYDVILTTYSIVSMEVPKQPLPHEPDEYGFIPFSKPKEKSGNGEKRKDKGGGRLADGQNGLSLALGLGPLARVAWFRVVLDEAQSIKNYRTQVARAAWGLRAKRRWCLSGTPIQNSIDDLFSYFRFLHYFPWDSYKKFRLEIKDPVVRTPIEGYRRLQVILKPVVLRRTKATFIDGQPIVNLPPRIVKLKQAEFSMEERSFYTSLETEMRKQFQIYAAAGTVQSNYVNILWMLLRLRQACDHPMLVKMGRKAQAAHKTALDSARSLPGAQRLQLIMSLDDNRAICPICQDAPEEPVVSVCTHVFCRQCISEQLANGDDTSCHFPKCGKPLNLSLVYTLSALEECSVDDSSNTSSCDIRLLARSQKKLGEGAEEEKLIWKSSSKIDAVINTLQALPRMDMLVEDQRLLKEGTEDIETQVQDPDEKAESCALAEPYLETTVAATRHGVESMEKAIVFSQWTSMLDLLEVSLQQAGFCYRRLDGTMSVSARDRAVSDFNTCPEVTVMIMSLKAASLGLNMVAACHVLLLDVWWNPTTEDQAIDRAHRIGQTRPVNVSRFTIKNTIEDRILALQEGKRQIVVSAFGENEGGEQKTRLTVEDLQFLFHV